MELAVDSHCHLDIIYQKTRKQFETWNEFKQLVHMDSWGGCVTNFCHPREWTSELLSRLQSVPNVKFTIGCHPNYASIFNDSTILRIEEIVAKDSLGKCVAIGECGLDLQKNDSSTLDRQKKVFKAQIGLALRLKKTLVLHIRKAEREGLSVLDSMGVPANYAIHRHCFNGSVEEYQTWMKRFPGSVIGITNLIGYKGTQGLQNVVKNMALDHLVLETDAPYFVPHQQMRLDQPVLQPLTTSWGESMSHPLHVINVAAKVAEIKGMPIMTILEANKKNIARIYNVRTRCLIDVHNFKIRNKEVTDQK